MYTNKFALLVLLAAVYLLPASAQERPSPKSADPSDAKAPVPPVVYRSVFGPYRPIGEDKLIPWKAANDEVARIGGWRVYAKEAREPDPAKSAAPVTETKLPAPVEQKAPQDHAGHKNH